MKNLITVFIVCLSLCIAMGCSNTPKTSGPVKANSIKVVEPNKMTKASGQYSILKSNQPDIGKGITLKPNTNRVSSVSLPAPQASSSKKTSPESPVPENTLPLIHVEPSEVDMEAEKKSFVGSVIFYYSVAIILGIIGYVVYLKVQKYKISNENPFKETYQAPKDKQLKLKI